MQILKLDAQAMLYFRLKVNLVKKLRNGVDSPGVSSKRDIDAIDTAVNDPENARLLFILQMVLYIYTRTYMKE